MNNPYQTKPATIIETRKLTPDQTWFKLEFSLNFKPGQFIEISLPGFGEGPVAPCGDPNDNKYIEIVVRNVGSLTARIQKLVIGDQIHLRGPYGNGWPERKMIKKDIILVAGGMGIIPLRPLIFDFLRHPLRFGNISLLIGGRSPEYLLFRDDFDLWQKNLEYFKTIVDEAPKNYKGRIGQIVELIKSIHFNPKNTIVLICGPEPMCPACIQLLTNKGLPEDQIFISLERRMKCGIGLCQHCNCGKYLVCQNGPVFSWEEIKVEMNK